MQPRVRSIARAAAIAGLYAGLCLLLAPISYRVLQVRAAEALTLLPMVWSEAVPGLILGALIANLVGPLGLVDVILGTSATAVAAWLTYRYRKSSIAPFWPVIINGLVVGAYLPFVTGMQMHLWVIPASMLAVAAGEAVAVFALGIPMMHVLSRIGVLK